MIDKDGNIVTLKEQIKRYYSFLKENTAQITIVISILAAVYKNMSDYYFYIVNCGYYKYFGIDATLMLPYNKKNFYQSVGQIAILIIYWGYAIFTVRILRLKRNYFTKVFLLAVIPLICSIILSLDEATMLVFCFKIIIYMAFQYILIYIMGYYMVTISEKDIVKAANKKNNKMDGLGETNYMIGGLLIMCICFAMVFYSVYYNSYRKAAEKRTFGIVVVDDERYAVIDANEEKLVLQQCEICGSTLRIDKNTYLCTDNEILIYYQTFDNVE